MQRALAKTASSGGHPKLPRPQCADCWEPRTVTRELRGLADKIGRPSPRRGPGKNADLLLIRATTSNLYPSNNAAGNGRTRPQTANSPP